MYDDHRLNLVEFPGDRRNKIRAFREPVARENQLSRKRLLYGSEIWSIANPQGE